MRTSVTWMNDYLDPPADPDEQANALTACGFPFEGREILPDGEIQQEIEMASNRGDCVCHAGMAREIAALTGRSFKGPTAHAEPTGPPASQLVRVENNEPTLCPLYTARVITGVKVGPSPEWLQQRLRAIGQIPRNNLVDATNFVLFELGQPTHVFDLSLLKGGQIIVRRAHDKEKFIPIGDDAVEVELDARDLVIADAERAVAIAGVKGGAETAISEGTTDILIEAASFERVSVRNSSRRLGIASDSSYRFERGVHPAEVGPAAERLIALILDIAGGTLHEGVVADGAPIPPPRVVSMRPERCTRLLGHELPTTEMVQRLASLEFDPVIDQDMIRCTVPPRRLDVSQEIDLVEEVGRTWGYERLDIKDAIEVSLSPLQGDQVALELVRTMLVGAGFVETISHSLISDQDAERFLAEGRSSLRVAKERAGGEPALRPSTLPSLLHITQRNRDRGDEYIRAFEIAAIFDRTNNEHRERRSLGMIIDAREEADATQQYRRLRGIIERLGGALTGREHPLEFRPPQPEEEGDWLQPRATILLDGTPVGRVGLLEGSITRQFGTTAPIAAGELMLEKLLEQFPPDTEARALPSFPPIDRDLSIIVAEDVGWAQMLSAAHSAGDDLLEEVSFVTTWRDEKIGADRKSVTMRLRFRSEQRTLRHAEVDPQVEAIARAVTSAVDGELRA